MRLWSVNPEYLDAAGLAALWREGLLARKALSGGTKGYRNHPQLARFKNTAEPVAAMDAYLQYVLNEALARGYRFDALKITGLSIDKKMPVTEGQLEYEWRRLLAKLEERSPSLFMKFKSIILPEPHPLFGIVPGGIEQWEKQKG